MNGKKEGSVEEDDRGSGGEAMAGDLKWKLYWPVTEARDSRVLSKHQVIL